MERSKYYIPRTKMELVRWCKHRFPFATDEFKNMSKKRLYAIYYWAIKKHEEIK